MPLIHFRNQLIEKSIWKSKGKTHVSLSICHAKKRQTELTSAANHPNHPLIMKLALSQSIKYSTKIIKTTKNSFVKI